MTNKLKSFTDSATDVIKLAVTEGKVIAPPDVVKYRLDVCETCPRSTGFNCLECGCKLVIKTKFLASKCPLSKW